MLAAAAVLATSATLATAAIHTATVTTMRTAAMLTAAMLSTLATRLISQARNTVESSIQTSKHRRAAHC
jgi:hypothetical protein